MIREKIISIAGRCANPSQAEWTSRPLSLKHVAQPGSVPASRGFNRDARLPYHVHHFSEAVTVLEGTARVFVEGRAYRLCPRDCVHVPSGIAHQVQNDDPVKACLRIGPLRQRVLFGS